MRLIDADELIKAMAPIISECKDPETMGNVIKSIEGQPTAFDKYRVMSELFKRSEEASEEMGKCDKDMDYWHGVEETYLEAYEIVFVGGIDG